MCNFPYRMAFGVSEHHFCSATPKVYLSLQVDHKDGVLSEFKQCSLLPGCNLLLPPFGNVPEYQYNANHLSSAGEDWRGTVLDWNFTAISSDQIHVAGHGYDLLLFEYAKHFIVCGHAGFFINELKHIPNRLVKSFL